MTTLRPGKLASCWSLSRCEWDPGSTPAPGPMIPAFYLLSGGNGGFKIEAWPLICVPRLLLNPGPVRGSWALPWELGSGNPERKMGDTGCGALAPHEPPDGPHRRQPVVGRWCPAPDPLETRHQPGLPSVVLGQQHDLWLQEGVCATPAQPLDNHCFYRSRKDSGD